MNEDEQRPLTIAELITQLQQYDPSLPVFTEGCDCWGAARRVARPTPLRGQHHPFSPDDGVIIERWEA